MAVDATRILVTRPQPGASQTAERLSARGYEPVIVPLFKIVPDPDLSAALADADRHGPQAVVFTSVNGPRVLVGSGGVPDTLLQRPVYAVGLATAEAAKIAGFNTVSVAPSERGGDAAGLTTWLSEQCDPKAGPILHLHGAHRAADLSSLLAGSDLQVVSQAIYESVPDEGFRPTLDTALDQAPISAVLHYSPRAARYFAKQAGAAGIPAHVCLSQSVSDSLREAMADIGVSASAVMLADDPNEPALLHALDNAKLTLRHGH